VEPSIVFLGGLGGLVLLLSHYYAYKVGTYQGGLGTVRPVPQGRKAGIALREGETFLGVVDADKGPCFFLTNARTDFHSE
jgi:hypothetical protein